MKPVARIGDQITGIDAHGCLICPHTVVGTITSVGSPNVKINNIPVAIVGDKGSHTVCCGVNQFLCTKGSSTVFINNMPVVRTGDSVTLCGGVGTVISGSQNVLIGG